MADTFGGRLGAEGELDRPIGARSGSDAGGDAGPQGPGGGATGKEAQRPDDKPAPRAGLASQIGSDWPFT